MSMDYRERVEKGLFDRVTVIDENGDKVDVFNWLTVKSVARVRGDNPVYEQFDDEVRIGAGDSWMDPDAVTERVAEEMKANAGIDVRDHGIRVIDPTAEEADLV